MSGIGLVMAALAVSAPFRMAASVHVHTTFSDGKHTMDEVAQKAKAAGMNVLIVTDHFNSQIEYGPPLFRKALAFSVSRPSVDPDELGDYLRAAERAQRRTGLLILTGVEVTPFYYWQGAPWSGNLRLRSAHRHLLVVFPRGADATALGPVLARASAPGADDFGLDSLTLLWPLALLLWALYRLSRRASPPETGPKRSFRDRRPPVSAVLVAALSVVALIRAWPYRVPDHDPYAGNAGIAPYQAAIDASKEISALAFWAHPETSASYRHPRYPVGYRSDPYPALIADTEGATGFAALYEGYRTAAGVGGTWDDALADWVAGRRAGPVWALGELDLHEEGEAGGKFFGEVETVLFTRHRTQTGVLEALAAGRMYASRRSRASRLILDTFSVRCRHRNFEMGDRSAALGPCRVTVRLEWEGEAAGDVETTLVSNGEVASQQSVTIRPGGSELTWDVPGPATTTVYRFTARRGNQVFLISNPITIEVTEGPG